MQVRNTEASFTANEATQHIYGPYLCIIKLDSVACGWSGDVTSGNGGSPLQRSPDITILFPGECHNVDFSKCILLVHFDCHILYILLYNLKAC